MKRSNQFKGLVFACITAFFWGMLAVALQYAVKHVADPFTIIWFRFTTAFLVLFSYYAYANPMALRKLFRPTRFVWLAAVSLAINYYGFMKGVELIGARASQIIIQLGPIMLCVIGVYYYGEKITKRQIPGFFVALAGFGLFYLEQLKSFTEAGSFNIGALFTFVAAVGWTTYGLGQKEATKERGPQETAMFIYLFGMLAFTPMANYSLFPTFNGLQWGVMAFLALNTLVAYGCMGEALKYADASKVSVIVAANPVVTFIIVDFLIFVNANFIEARTLSVSSYFGAAMVIGGAIWAVKPPRRR